MGVGNTLGHFYGLAEKNSYADFPEAFTGCGFKRLLEKIADLDKGLFGQVRPDSLGKSLATPPGGQNGPVKPGSPCHRHG